MIVASLTFCNDDMPRRKEIEIETENRNTEAEVHLHWWHQCACGPSPDLSTGATRDLKKKKTMMQKKTVFEF